MSNVSLDDYDRFFDAQMDIPHNKSLPDLVDDSPKNPDIYKLPLDDRQAPASKPLYKVSSQILDYDFDAHHNARYYPHAHQTLKTSHKPKQQKKRDSKRREKKGARPSHQYFPSLRQVSEHDREISQGSDDETSAIIKRSELADTHASSAPSELSHTDDIDNGLIIPVSQSKSGGLLSVEVPADSASDSSLTSLENKDEEVTFTLGEHSKSATHSMSTEDKGSEHAPNTEAPHNLDSISNSSQSEPVRFTLGASYSNASFTPPDQNNSSGGSHEQSTSHGRSHTSEDLSTRRRPGSEVELSTITRALHKVPSITSPDEAALLNSLDLEDVASHRLENVRGIRRHKIKRKSHSNMDVRHPTFNEPQKPAADHTPHELFIELDELVVRTHENDSMELWEWKEKARWIKFEEDVLDSAGRWGRPHVPSLSFHSLIELRRLLENGLVALDLDVNSYLNMMEQIVDRMILSGQMKTESKDYVMNALLLRHSHLDGKSNFLRSRSYGNLKGLESLSRHRRSNSGHTASSSRNERVELAGLGTDHITLKNAEEGVGLLPDGTAQDSLHHSKSHLPEERYNLELLKKIPAGSETVSVLVGTLKGLSRPATALVRLYNGLPLEHIAEVPLPVRFVFLCIGPLDQGLDYVEIGRSMSTLMSNPIFRDAIYGARDRQTILKAMNGFLDDSMVLPPGEFDRKTLLPIMYMAKQKLDKKKKAEEMRERFISHSSVDDKGSDDPLRRTRRPFGGLVNDIKRRYPKYLSDLRDGVNVQVLAAFIFIYFACLSPAITFGGLLADKTDRLLGASEMLLATTIAGIIFSIFSGQPLLITGFTGPLIVFEEGIFQFADANGIDFLAWRLWVGCWIFIISIVLVGVEASFLIRFVSRFTQEIFAFLISLIFIYEVFVKLVNIFHNHPLCENYTACLEELLNTTYSTLSPDLSSSVTQQTNSTTVAAITSNPNMTLSDNTTTPTLPLTLIMQPNTALLSMSLTLFTFTIAYYLKGIRNKKVLGRMLRRALGDFGVPIAILVMCVIDLLIGDKVYTQKLSVPPKFSVTRPEKRGWFINPLGNSTPLPIGHYFSAALPALLGSILIFMETLIAGMIVNKNENRLKKGTGFHLDILILGVLAMINGFLGLPFVCCATVRSVTHTSALTVMSKNNVPGEKPKIEGVLEQRISSLLVHILIGASMFLGVVLSYIPVAVLFGVFLYMGVASLGGIQLYQRIILLLTPTKHHPLDVCFVRHVRMRKMHTFTIIQILCCGALWAVKSSPGSLAFPFVLILLVPFRMFVLTKFFSEQELGELDKAGSSEVLAVAGDADEPDFYETAHMPN